MLGATLNINGKKLSVLYKYCPAVPLDPNNAEIKGEPERVIVSSISEFGREINPTPELLEEIETACLKAVKGSFYNKDV